MSHFSTKTKYLKHLEHRLSIASTKLQTLKGKEISTYHDKSTIANANGYSLSIVKKILTDKCFEYIQSYKLDLNFYDIRMLQITLNVVEKYWYTGIFKGTAYKEYKNEIKKFKMYAYAAIGLDYYSNLKCIEVPILPHVMKGLLRRYFTKMDMPKKTIDIIFGIFDDERLPKMTHKQIKKIELLCDSLEVKLEDKKIDFKEEDLYPLIIEHFGQDYFITKDPNRSRWNEYRVA